MLQYDPKRRYTINIIEDHQWIYENTVVEAEANVKEEYTKKRKPKKSTRGKRGAVNTGEKGGTNPYSIQGEDFIIIEESRPAYSNDEREQQLIETTTIDDLMQVLDKYCEEHSEGDN